MVRAKEKGAQPMLRPLRDVGIRLSRGAVGYFTAPQAHL